MKQRTNLKWFFAVLLSAVLMLSFCIIAFATNTETPSDTTEAVAKIGEKTYTSLGDAVAAAPTDGTETTITLLKSAEGGGVKVVAGQNIVFDFAGYTYTVGEPTVGSTGTETNGFQLLKGSKVTMKNGILKASSYQNLKIVLQNYCDLTLLDMEVDAREAPQVTYVSSNNNGSLNVIGNTSIYAAEGRCAFDAYYWPNNGYVDGVSITVDTTGTIAGNIEYGSDGSATGKADIAEKTSLVIKNGEIDGNISTYNLAAAGETGISITGGSFTSDVSAYVAEGNELVQNPDGTFSIGVDESTAVAEVNGVGYTSVQKAIDAIGEGSGEIKLVQSTNEDVVIASGNITLNLNNCTLTNVSSDTITVKLGATLTVTGEGTVDNKTNARAAIFNNGTVILNGGTYDRTSETGESADISGGNSWYTICNHGTMTINEGVTVKNTGSFSSMIENGYYNYTSGNERTGYVAGINAANPTLTINEGIFVGGLNTVKNDDGAKLEINGGTYTNTTQAAILNWNIATITDGTFECSAANCVLNGASTSDASENDQGVLTITGGSFTSTGTPIANYFTTSDGISVSGGTFSAEIPKEYCAQGNKAILGEDGTYSIGADETVAVAEVNGKGYLTLSAALDAIETEGTVKLLQAVSGESITVPAGKKITLDLNGKTLTDTTDNGIVVLGELTVQNLAETGELNTKKSILVDGNTAKFILDSGAVVCTDDYGVYCKNGGTAVVNNGSIASKYAALTGNNTTGNMNFEVHGGTLTAAQGPAIYMPGQGVLTITDGVLNGGISLRMGQVNISGGTIYAITENIDSPADYYTYSGNAWFPDALYVFGGTYTSNDATNGNSLNLNITGGELICANGQGSAVAIYDLAKTTQAETVQISGNAVLTTNAEDRLAYQVLTLADIGVETPAQGYGQEALAGKVDTAISGGKFSTEVPQEYCVNNFYPTLQEDGTYTVDEHTTHTWNEGVVTIQPLPGKAGEKKYTCTVCGEVRTEILPALHAHTYDEETWHYDNVMHWHECTVCGGKKDTQVHVWDEGKVIVPATHESEGTSLFTCVICGMTKEMNTERIGEHSFGAWTPYDEENHVHTCACGEVEYEAHEFGEWFVAEAATTTKEGVERRTCTACGAYEERAIPVLPEDTTTTDASTTPPETMPVTETVVTDPSATTAPEGSGNGSTVVWVIVIVAVVLAGAIVGVVLYNKKKKAK